jgi:hypothetical protein
MTHLDLDPLDFPFDLALVLVASVAALMKAIVPFFTLLIQNHETSSARGSETFRDEL